MSLSGGYSAAAETKISRRRRYIMPYGQAWKLTVRYLGAGAVGFGAVALGIYSLKVLGIVVGGVATLALLTLFVQRCTPSD